MRLDTESYDHSPFSINNPLVLIHFCYECLMTSGAFFRSGNYSYIL